MKEFSLFFSLLKTFHYIANTEIYKKSFKKNKTFPIKEEIVPTSCGGTYDCAAGIPNISPRPPRESPPLPPPPNCDNKKKTCCVQTNFHVQNRILKIEFEF